MPVGRVGEKNRLDSVGVTFFELKTKGQKLHFRLLSPEYAFEGKHFQALDNGEYSVVGCPRVNYEDSCPLCEKYRELTAPIKELKKELREATDERKAQIKLEIEKLEKQAKPYKVSIFFYYLVLDRADGKAKIFKTTLSTRIKLEELEEMGVDVLGGEFIVMRSEKPGDYYPIVAVDSAKIEPLNEAEAKEVERAKTIDLVKIIDGRTSNFEPRDEVKSDDRFDDVLKFWAG